MPMNSTERVASVILGKPVDRQPIYGWVSANLSEEISREFGSVEAFEDHYEYDMAHIFGGPYPYRADVLERLCAENDELTPDLLLEADFLTDPDDLSAYANIAGASASTRRGIASAMCRRRGFFEPFNDVFGIGNQLLWMAMYPDEPGELYARQAAWNIRFAAHCIDLGADMIRISDDWGAQKDLMFNPQLWWEIIYPNMKKVVDYIHSRGCFARMAASAA